MSRFLQPPPLRQLIEAPPYGPRFARQLQEIDYRLPSAIGRVDELGGAVGDAVIRCALSFACQSQHQANIFMGRAALLEAPRTFVVARLPALARTTLDLGEAWEVRRLLEVLSLVDSGLLRSFAVDFLASENAEIREDAREFLEPED